MKKTKAGAFPDCRIKKGVELFEEICVLCHMSYVTMKNKKKDRGGKTLSRSSSQTTEDRLPDTSLLYRLVSNDINANGSVT